MSRFKSGKKRPRSAFQIISAVKTNPGGFYSVALAPGKFKIYFYSEIANCYLWQEGSPRRFTSEWFDNHGSMNWDMMIDEAEVFTVAQGEQKTINGVLETAMLCFRFGKPCPGWPPFPTEEATIPSNGACDSQREPLSAPTGHQGRLFRCRPYLPRAAPTLLPLKKTCPWAAIITGSGRKTNAGPVCGLPRV